MSELFGISMNLIMYVLVALLAVALSTVVIVALRNPVMFKIGVRNIPRRRAQTILIVIGLMLSTLIISAAFTTGDTVDRSITSQVYSLLGSVDQTIRSGTDNGDESIEDEDPETATRDVRFQQSQVQGLISALENEPLIDAVVPVIADIAVAVNPDKRLSAPVFTLTGVDAAAFGDLPDIRDVDGGGSLSVADLGPNEIYITQSAADELDAEAGDRLTLFVLLEEYPFTVKAVVEDKRLAGSAGVSGLREGGVVPLSKAQEMFKAPGELTYIAVSNQGDARGGLAHADEVEAIIRTAARSAPVPLAVSTVKATSVEFAEQGANIFTTFFLALGLFSIGAGILLIFMIFLMLAAERKTEMGMSRAVGTKRGDLVQTFLAEGMSYNILAAAVGTLFGVGVAVIIARVMASTFGAAFDLNISPHVTARSLIISYALGVVLTFFTVTFSSWRISNINIVRAIRDIPDPPPQRPNWRHKGILKTVRDLFFKETDRRGWIERGLFLLAVVLQIAGLTGQTIASIIGAVVWFVLLVMIAASRVEFGVPARAVLAVLMFLVTPVTAIVFFFQTFQIGPLMFVLGVLLTFIGGSELNAFALYGGLSFMIIGLALLIRSFGANERLTYTLAGLALLYIWLFDFEFELIESIFGDVGGDIEMFFLSGVMITVASAFLAVYNSDIFVFLFTRFGQRLGALLPSIRMAIAYPLANRMRTGMTMSMFTLVVFALIVMSTMNYNFEQVFVSDRALGGWDVTAEENPTNPIDDFEDALASGGSDVVAEFESVGIASLATGQRASICQLRAGNTCEAESQEGFEGYRVFGLDEGFIANQEIFFQTRARGYADADAIWSALARDPSLAVIDANALTGDFGAPIIEGVDAGAREMDPIEVEVLDERSGETRTFTVIGVIELGTSGYYFGLHIQQQAFEQLFSEPDQRVFHIQTVAGSDNIEIAREIESTLLNAGVQADSLKRIVEEQSSFFAGFLRLLQGFMGLGLVVGVAAVGVVAFRTVVERRQQIGMLRALGYTKGMVGLTFLLETFFIAVGGIGTGIVFGLILSSYLIQDEFANQGVVNFVIPWVQVAVIGGLALGSALLMTLLPSRQASSIPIATALRYE